MTRAPAGLTEITGDLDDAVRDIPRALSAWFPPSTHPGGFAWEAATGQLPDRITVVRDAGAVIGWAACSADDARVECAPSDDDTTDLLTAWLLDAAGEARVSVAVHRGQDRLRGILVARGFVDEAVPLAGLRHAAHDTGAQPPAGYRIRPVEAGEERAKVDAHRRAWKPVDLPFTDGSGDGVDPDAESRFDADGYAAMRHALDVCRRVGELGGHDLFINASPLPYYRAPWDAYVAAGFTPMERGTRMRRPA
jgi:hypothetical protein